MTDAKQGDMWYYDNLSKRVYEVGIEQGRNPRSTALVATAIGQEGRTHAGDHQ